MGRGPGRVVLALLAVAFGAARAEAKPRPLTGDERRDLIEPFREYLAVGSEDFFHARTRMLRRLRTLREGGADPLADVDALMPILYAARPFATEFDRRTAPKGSEVHVDEKEGSVSVRVDPPTPEPVRITYALPPRYELDAKRIDLAPPWPLIVTLHDLVDFQDEKSTKPFPGEEVIRRRWSRNGPLKAVRDGWMVFAPVAVRGRFSAKGEVTKSLVPLPSFWRAFHVDFERIVIEGGSDALLFASQNTVFYSGVILRDPRLTMPESFLPFVRNFAQLPVYVVGGTDDSPIVQQLTQAGHPDVKRGPPEGLSEWLGKLPKRPTPKSFHYASKNASTLAWWVNVDELAWGPDVWSLDVEAVDTKEDPNAVRIDADGVSEVTIFLNDRLLDLDRPVRVVANGREITECRVDAKPVTLPAKIQRSLDTTFEPSWGSARKGMYYGFIYPVQLQAIGIPPARHPPLPPTSPPPEPAPRDEGSSTVVFVPVWPYALLALAALVVLGVVLARRTRPRI